MAAIEMHHLTKHYNRGKIKALTDFTLEVEQGQIFSLLGPNGAGKTTLIKILLGIVHPTYGSAKLMGTDIRDVNSHQYLGYLPENHRFPEYLTPRQIIHYFGEMSGLHKSEISARLPELMQLVKLEKWVDQKVKKFSKGMLQRVGIAQALINKPKILFLDEPTDGIDPVGRKEIRDILLQLAGEGTTIFLNSHLLSEVERVSEQIAILNKGRLIESGRIEDFISIKSQYILKTDDNKIVEHVAGILNISSHYSGENLVVEVDSVQNLNAFIDYLRGKNVLIESIIPRQISLEDFFIKVIENEEQEA